jgi:hypothetical protein
MSVKGKRLYCRGRKEDAHRSEDLPSDYLDDSLNFIYEQLMNSDLTVITIKTSPTLLVAAYKRYPELISRPVKIFGLRRSSEETQFHYTFNAKRDLDATKWLFTHLAQDIMMVGGGLSFSTGMRHIIDSKTSNDHTGIKDLNLLLRNAETGSVESILLNIQRNSNMPQLIKWEYELQIPEELEGKSEAKIEHKRLCVERWGSGAVEFCTVRMLTLPCDDH